VINPSVFFALDRSFPAIPDLFHPATGKLITTVSEATPKDVDIAVEAAQKAFDSTWGLNVSGAQRAALLNKLGDLMVQHKDELAAIESLDNGGARLILLTNSLSQRMVLVQEKHSDMLSGSISPSRSRPSSTTLGGQTRLPASRLRYGTLRNLRETPLNHDRIDGREEVGVYQAGAYWCRRTSVVTFDSFDFYRSTHLGTNSSL